MAYRGTQTVKHALKIAALAIENDDRDIAPEDAERLAIEMVRVRVAYVKSVDVAQVFGLGFQRREVVPGSDKGAIHEPRVR